MRCNRKTACLAVTPRKKVVDSLILPRFCSYAAMKNFKAEIAKGNL